MGFSILTEITRQPLHLIIGINSSIAKELVLQLKTEKIIGTYSKKYNLDFPSSNSEIHLEKYDMRLINESSRLAEKFRDTKIKKITFCAGQIGNKKLARYSKYEIVNEYMINVVSFTILISCLLKQNSIVNGATICSVSSEAAFNPAKGKAVYSGTKSGLNALSLALNEELRDAEIKFFSICPNFFISPSTAYMAKAISSKGLSRMITAKQVAGKIKFLHDNPSNQAVIHDL